jgi:transmembrane sensor
LLRIIHMNTTEALIERFLNNECNEAEQQAVKAYFTQHPEILNKYMTEQTWRAFKPGKQLPEPVSEKMLAVIRQQTWRKRRLIITRWWAAAAAVLLFVSGAWWYTHIATPAPEKAMAKKTTITPAPANEIFHRSNTTSKTQSITLEDGTRVKLAPQSELSYPVPFMKDRRDITLKGLAVFYVAKDASRPFTVHAGKLATTAIGTVFRITAFDGKTTSVHLLSGKVRVQADSSVQLNGSNITYLLPGQELRLNVRQHLVLLNKKESPKTYKPSQTIASHRSEQTDSTITVFRNEPLANILITLSEKYQTKILFRPEQVEGITFTGRYDHQKERLAAFIQTIGLLNNLVMHEENGSIIIETQ